LARCGFNSFELADADLENAATALSTFSAAYQPSNDAGSRSSCSTASGVHLPAPEAQADFLTHTEALSFVTLAADFGFHRLIGG